MFKLISIMIRLTVLAAVLLSVQKATMPLRPPKNSGHSDTTAALGKCGSATSKASTKESAGVAGLLGGKGLDLQDISPLTVLPKLMGLANRDGGIGGLPEAGAPEQAAKPEQPTGPITVIRYSEADAHRGKNPRASVTTLPPGASATMVDGRLQIFYPSGKPKESK